MSVQGPATVFLTIGKLIDKVKSYLQDRSDVSETQSNEEMRPSAWIRDALREITQKYAFEELRKPGPIQIIGPGLGWQGSNFAYKVSYFLYGAEDYTRSEDPVIFLTASQFAQVNQTAVLYGVNSPLPLLTTGNTVGYAMNYMTMKAIQSLLFVPGGIPFLYTRYGDLFYFGSQPGAQYQVYLPYQRKHPFSSELTESLIYVPEEWFEVVAIAAAEKGAYKLRWNDQAVSLHAMLWGDPDYERTGAEQGKPGMIAALTTQPERDMRMSPVQISVANVRY